MYEKNSKCKFKKVVKFFVKNTLNPELIRILVKPKASSVIFDFVGKTFSKPVGAASQWWSNEWMMINFELMMERKMLVNDGEMLVMMVKWVYDHTLFSPPLTSISPSLTSILPSLAWSKSSFAQLTIIEKLHRLQAAYQFLTTIMEFEYFTDTYFLYILRVMRVPY